MIIVLSGKARSGKDTVANILEGLFHKEKRTVRVIAYADFLKTILSKCFLLSPEQLYGNMKEAPIEGLKMNTGSLLESDRCWTPRELLQYIGTDVFRKINPDCWVNVVRSKALYDSDAAHTIITDGRFPNEIDWVVERGGFHIHIERSERDFSNNNTHISETSLDNINCCDNTFVLHNNGTLDALKIKIDNIWRNNLW